MREPRSLLVVQRTNAVFCLGLVEMLMMSMRLRQASIKWSVILLMTAFALSLLPTAAASHDAGASISIRQEASPDDECKQFFVEVEEASSASATLQIWQHLAGTAPDDKLHEEEITGAPDDGGGFDFEAGPFEPEDISDETTDLYVRVSWTDADGSHGLMSNFFNVACEGGPGPIPDCPANVQAVALDDGTIRLTWEPVEGAEAYFVFRGTPEIPFSILGSTEDTVFIHEDASPGETFVYTVRTFADGSEAIGCDHAEATAIPFFGAPVVGALAAIGAVGTYAWIGRRKA